jgi:hypothetical protein
VSDGDPPVGDGERDGTVGLPGRVARLVGVGDADVPGVAIVGGKGTPFRPSPPGGGDPAAEACEEIDGGVRTRMCGTDPVAIATAVVPIAAMATTAAAILTTSDLRIRAHRDARSTG